MWLWLLNGHHSEWVIGAVVTVSLLSKAFRRDDDEEQDYYVLDEYDATEDRQDDDEIETETKDGDDDSDY